MRCSKALITRAIHSVVGGIKLLRDAFLINGILYVEKATLSGVEREIGSLPPKLGGLASLLQKK